MYKIDFKKPLSVYFIGIGGISMSGLAQILHFENFTVSGSDEKHSPTTEILETLGININYSHQGQNITSNIDLVVFSAAVKPTNPEYATAMEKHIPILSRAQLLGQIMDNYTYSFAVSGTHGKTTTTSMVSELLINAQLDPTITVGGMLDSINGNIRVGKSEYFVTEACEYCNSFLSFNAKVAIILNIEEDHLDFFKDIDDIRASFKKFACQVPDNGAIIINSDIDNYEYIVEDSKSKIITFGTRKESTFRAENISFNDKAQASYDLFINNEFVDKIDLSANGLHNVYNSLAMIAAGYYSNIPLAIIKQSILSFKNAHRRFEYKGTLQIKDVSVIDDYAHHPTEVKTTLETAKLCTSKHIWCIFQPHTYTRTRLLLDDFATALSVADTVILCDIYAAREKFTDVIHSKDLQNKLVQSGHNTLYFDSFSKIEEYIINNILDGDLLITMGAGDVYKIGEDLLSLH
jgi:UDP-N-acetylmuramate--alanine ligase